VERPKFFVQEGKSRQVVLELLGSSDHPLDLEDIFTSVKEKRPEFTTDVIEHSVWSCLDNGTAQLTPDLKVEAVRK